MGIGARILSFLSLHISLFIVVPQTLVLMDSRDQYVGERSSQGEESVEQALHRQVTRLTRENQKLKMFLNHLLSHSISCNLFSGERYRDDSDYVLG